MDAENIETINKVDTNIQKHGQSDALAVVKGKPIDQIPDDLYIPPEALKVMLQEFQGPLDLLLYLIKRNNMEILDIKIAEITEQYMSYISFMEASQFELVGDYLVMAATLAEIKSKMLLPRNEECAEDDDEDPRAALVRRLQEYERFKLAAIELDHLPREERDSMVIQVAIPQIEKVVTFPDVNMSEILTALNTVLNRNKMYTEHVIEKEVMTTRDRMVTILNKLPKNRFVPFVSLFTLDEGKIGVIITFIALLELVKESLIEIVQNSEYGLIHIKMREA